MTRGKQVLLLLTILIIALAAACGESKQPASAPAGPDTEESRMAAAKKYLEAMPPAELLKDMANRIAPNVPENKRQLFMDLMSSKEMQDAAYRFSLEALVKNFSLDELNALVGFFGSPGGKSASKKFGLYMAEVMPKINQEVRTALEKVQPEPPAPKEQQGQKEPQGPKEQPAPKEQKAPGSQAPGSKAPTRPAPGGAPAGQTPGK